MSVKLCVSSRHTSESQAPHQFGTPISVGSQAITGGGRGAPKCMICVILSGLSGRGRGGFVETRRTFIVAKVGRKKDQIRKGKTGRFDLEQ